ncbi:hypothetical protein [Paenibacillus sp. CGMCC 1.18879]|uniref:hypothetical protein n=1 Tax=Paenibacillus sp. CGMCC 1.18879 TaxID=2834466 RepID=UPI001CA80C62|nr:hypothetical protein [Paenibacillus sp. CGMCC 1.18879]MBY9078934.1 hypothetical protein [Paenibacillus sp. CGMCC 1.18879]
MANINESKAQKLLKKAVKGNDEIHFLWANGEELFTYIGGARVKPSISLVCHVNSQSQICLGKIENKPVFLSEGEIESLVLGVVFDTRDTDDIQCHYNNNDYEAVYKNDPEGSTDGLLIAYVENASFSQLFLYDQSLDHKYISSFAKQNNSKLLLRTIAFSYIGRLYPDIHELLKD